MNSLFNIGDRVVCVDSKGAIDLIEGKSYVISGFVTCPSCNLVAVTVGIKIKMSADDYSGYKECTICNARWRAPKSSEYSYKQTRFVRPETDQALEDEIRESLNKELIIREQ